MENKKGRGRPVKFPSAKKNQRVCINVHLDEDRMRRLMFIKAYTGYSSDDIFADVVSRKIDTVFDECKDKLKEFLDI